MKESKIDSFRLFFPVIYGVLIISLFSLIMKYPKEYWSGGNGLGLMGFATHQNMLGSIMLILVSLLSGKLFYEFTVSKEKKKLFFLSTATIIALVILIITFSRGAIVSYLVFGFFFLLLETGFKKTFLTIGAIVLLVLFLSRIEVINNYINYTVYKGADNLLSSRKSMYEGSFEAAKHGGLLGLGYGVSDPSIVEGVPGHFSNGKFVREKGSTLLALVEEVGIVGAFLFYLPVVVVIGKAVRRKREEVRSKKEKEKNLEIGSANYEVGSIKQELGRTKTETNEINFLIAIIIAMTLHSQFEAWGVGVGSVLLPVYLLFQFRLWDLIEQ